MYKSYINMIKYMYDLYGGEIMSFDQEFDELVKKNNGLIRYCELTNIGYNQRQIKKLEIEMVIERVEKGIYCHKDYYPDMLKVHQLNNNNIIYSHETAAFLHDLTDRFPRKFTVTTESGYHLRKRKELNIHYIKKDLFTLGAVEIKDMSGNIVRAFDKERTICDFIKNRDQIEMQVYVEVLQNYFNGKVKLNKLSNYARKLGVNDKVEQVVTLMMKP